VTPATVDAGLRRIRFDEGTLFVELSPDFEEARVGGEPVPRAEPVYVGVTAVTPDGAEIDLIVQTLFPGALEQPVVFTAELDREVDHVLVGLWDQKIEPCEVDRYGCQAFGFVLDGNLATWPPRVYDTGQRQRLLAGEVPLRVVRGRELEPARAAALGAASREALAGVAGLFGAEVTLSEAEGVTLLESEVRYAHPRDAYAARVIAERLGVELGQIPRVRQLSTGLDVAFEVVLGRG
jgi:hypothetical protein